MKESSCDKLARKKADAAMQRTVKYIDKKFPTEKDCAEEINRRILRDKKCDCGCSKFIVEYGAKWGRCKRCNKKIWITAGTVLKRMRAARPYLVPIILFERGIPFNSLQLQKLVGTAYSTALGIFKKITSAVIDAMTEKGIAVSSFDFSEIICKRSKETEARKHPSTEQEELQQNPCADGSTETIDAVIESKILSILNPETVSDPGDTEATQEATSTPDKRIDPASLKNLCGNGKVIYKLLSNQPVSIDQLVDKSGLDISTVSVSLSILELAQLAKSLPGNLFIQAGEPRLLARSPLNATADTAASVNQAIVFIRRYFHGISRRCLQLYLGAYWCIIDRARWRKGGLFKECTRSRSAGNIELKLYVSPSTVLFCAA